MDYFNINNNLSGVYAVVNSIRETLKPYAEAMEVFQKNMKGVLEVLSEETKPVRAFYILGKHQFTYWKPLSADEVEKIITISNINSYLAEKIDDKSFVDYEALCDKMVQSAFLSDTNKAILSQSIEAMNNGLYDLALVGIVTVFDGVLTAVTKDNGTNIEKRLNKIRNKLKSLTNEKWQMLNEAEISVYGMYITWTEVMKDFQKFSDFKKPEKEPEDLNRHWISHGRKTTNAAKLDVCKMINALYGLMYFGNAA